MRKVSVLFLIVSVGALIAAAVATAAPAPPPPKPTFTSASAALQGPKLDHLRCSFTETNLPSSATDNITCSGKVKWNVTCGVTTLTLTSAVFASKNFPTGGGSITNWIDLGSGPKPAGCTINWARFEGLKVHDNTSNADKGIPGQFYFIGGV